MASSILVVRGLIDVLEAAGVDRQDFFRATGFDAARLTEQDERIELAELDALHEAALDATGNDALGLKLGEMASPTTFSLIAHLVAHAATLRDGIDALLKFYRLLTDHPVWELREDGPLATLRCDIRPGPLRCRRFRAEAMIGGLFRIFAHFDRDSRPNYVAFDYEAPSYHAEYLRTFGGLERFAQPFNGIVFERRLLDGVQLHQDPEFHALMVTQAEKRVSRLANTITYAERVRDFLLTCAPSDRHDMATVARHLGMSARSLRRRLHEEGVSYVEVSERALAALATRLIVDEQQSIEATAYAMGYSVPAAFHRAFKRWTGSTPAALRAKERAADGDRIGHGR